MSQACSVAIFRSSATTARALGADCRGVRQCLGVTPEGRARMAVRCPRWSYACAKLTV
jgi:hypothetical protein